MADAAGTPPRDLHEFLGLYRRARANGVHFAWMTFDEAYGGKPPLLRAFDEITERRVDCTRSACF